MRKYLVIYNPDLNYEKVNHIVVFDILFNYGPNGLSLSDDQWTAYDRLAGHTCRVSDYPLDPNYIVVDRAF